MKLVGSRILGINGPQSDYDLVELDGTGSTYADITNEHLCPGFHCYHYPKEYRENLGKYIIPTEDDIQWIYNPEDYLAGVITDNPFDYEETWKSMLKNLDFHHHLFYNQRTGYKKKFYHIVYNLLSLENHSFDLDEEQLAYLKSFHDLTAEPQDYEHVIKRIASVC
jgi:hypothetical protein